MFECNDHCGQARHVFDLETRGSAPVGSLTGSPSWDSDGDVVTWTEVSVERRFERLHRVK